MGGQNPKDGLPPRSRILSFLAFEKAYTLLLLQDFSLNGSLPTELEKGVLQFL
jgi:hypothetical protein